MARLFILFLLILSGCASSLKSFKPDETDENHAAVLGRVRVQYNGRDHTENCGICFDSVNGPCYQFDSSGLLAINLPPGSHELRMVSCKDVSIHHFEFEGAQFTASPKSQTYLGDVTIDWKAPGGFKISSLFGALGAIIDYQSNDGTAKMSVKNNRQVTIRELEGVTGPKGLKVHESLILLR